MNKGLKIGLEILLAVIICLLVWLTVKSVQKPVKFNQELKARSEVAIQRLKDIRTLQVAFKSVNGRFSPSVDSLKIFYETGKMDIVMQIGSNDDSIAVANTEAIKKANKKLKPAEITAKLQEAYAAGTKVVFSTVTEIPVKDTLFRSRPDFCIDSLYYIPFSGKPFPVFRCPCLRPACLTRPCAWVWTTSSVSTRTQSAVTRTSTKACRLVA